MTLLLLKLSTFMVTMVFSHRRSTAWSVLRRGSCSHSQVWEHSIRILRLSEQQTFMYMACTFLVHLSLHWTDMGADNISLWPFAVKHVVWLYNHVPSFESGLTPMEFFTKQKADHRDILRSHVWGCPAYVLKPKLQNGQKRPKWNRRSRRGLTLMSILLSLLIFGT